MRRKYFLGIIFILIGLGFLFEQFGIWDFSTIISNWWPLILIVAGFSQLSKKSVSKVSGTILLVLGVLFQMKELNIITVSIIKFFWPLIIIAIGVSILIPRANKKNEYLFDRKEADEDITDNVVLFSGVKARNASKNFRGGSLVAAFGGIDMDLKDAVLSKNGATINATVAFGGIDIIVPPNWKVEVKGIPIFGGWSNKIKNNYDIDINDSVLTINCFVIFGGIDIKN